MAITKPYTFQAGTKARASEVNQDFDILYSEVNRIGTEILNIDIDIQNVAEGKADINGNATQRFQLANPENSYDGVNKNYLENAIENIKNYISGYTIIRNIDNSIIVTSGSCYDSGFTTMIISTGNITKENANQGANATYYVHVISDNTGNQVDILISTQSISPALPTGYTLYRQLGLFTTNNYGAIENIVSYGRDMNIPNGIASLTQSYVNGTSGYILFSNGFHIEWGTTGVLDETAGVNIVFLKPFTTSTYTISGSMSSPQSAGDKSNCWRTEGLTTTGFTLVAQFEGWNGPGVIRWLAVGF